MAFITNAQGNVISYAEAVDVRDKDQRIFESNEIDFTNVPDAPLTLDDYIEDLTTKTTDRINTKIRLSARWREYLGQTGSGLDTNNIPAFNPDRILERKADFTDMCAYGTLYMYLLPKVADFGNPESPEVQKIQYYEGRFNDLFDELMADFTWFDSDGDGTIENSEKQIRFRLNRRSRSRQGIARVR